MTLPYCLSPMHKEDIDQVTEIDLEAFPTQWPPANYRHELQNQLAHYIVVREAGRFVSNSRGSGPVAWVKRLFNRGLPSEPPQPYIAGFSGIWLMADEAHITSIAVRKNLQRRGIGELLLIGTIDLSMSLKARIVTLEVRVSNTPAQSLYLKYGFQKMGIRKAYYTDNREDATVMSTGPINLPPYAVRLKELREAYAKKYGANRAAQCTSGGPSGKRP